MRANFNRLEIHNFMSFGDEVFDFTSHKGMSLVTGKNCDISFDAANSKNGAGKSTVFLALAYGLYGQLPNKIKAEHIANRNIADKEVRVSVFLDVDGTQYRATTGMNKRAQSYFELVQITDGNEVDITKSSIAETRSFFEEEVLHCDISLFLRTILLTSEQNYNFFNLKKQDKRDFIEKLFDIGIFGDMHEAIHKDILQHDKSILACQNQMIVLEQNSADYAAKSKSFDEAKAAELAETEVKIAKAKGDLERLMSTAVEKNTDAIAKCEASLTKLDEASRKAAVKSASLSAKKSTISSNISMQQSIRRDQQKQIDKHADLMAKLCDDCKGVFSKHYSLDTCQSAISAADREIAAKNVELRQVIADQEALDTKKAAVVTKTAELKAKLTSLTADFNRAKAEQSAAERNLALLESNKSQLEAKKNPYAELIGQTEARMKAQQDQLDSYSKTYKYLKKAEEIVSHESLKKFIIKDLIGIINNRIKYYLTKMGANYTCVFDDSLDYEFITASGPCELQNFSCGEKKRLEIATCLSFRDFIAQRSNISSNILVIDEYIDSGIDTLAVESILSIFKDFTSSSNQSVFVISHRSEVHTEMFDRVIEVQKKDGISKIIDSEA